MMGRCKVRVSGDVLGAFFTESVCAFRVTKGLPEDVKLVDFSFDTQSMDSWAVFEPDCFMKMLDGKGVPEKEVEYTAYEVVESVH